MTFTTGKVYTFKFNSGEEMVAQVTGFNSSCIEISNPVSVAPGPQGIGLVPSMFTADVAKIITVNINSVAMYAETDDNVCAKYTEATTGIRVPDKKIIMG